MHQIPESEKPLYDNVVNASYRTYTPLTNQGLQVTPNPLIPTKRFVGREGNKIIPDIVVWRPNDLKQSSGTAVLVEQVETPSSVNILDNIENWRKLDNLQNVEFTLVVPQGNLAPVKGLLNQYAITPDKLQTYEYNPNTNGFIFRDQNLE